MSKITIRVEVDFSEGELKSLTGELWSKAEKRILAILRRYDDGRGVTTQQISRNASHTIPDAKSRAEILEQLIKEGIIEIVSQATGRRGARYAIRQQHQQRRK